MVGFFWLRLLGFAAVLLLALNYAVYVLTPKHDYGICSMVNLYEQDADSVDVLVLGTSLAYAGVNTNVLWREYGIAAYDLCSAEQPYWMTYYYLQEALKTQKPALILLDAKASTYQADYSKRGRAITGTYGIRSPLARWRAIYASVERENAAGFALAFPQIHSNYPAVEARDFVYPPDNGGRGLHWKGFIEVDETERHERPSMVWTEIKKPLNPRQKEYFEKILDLLDARGIPVLVVGMPNPDYKNDHMYYNALWSVADGRGVSGVNYNDPDLRFGLRYTTDFADWQHLNVKGSVTFSRRLGEDLLARFPLPDRRGDPAYESYELGAREWYERYPEYLPKEGETL